MDNDMSHLSLQFTHQEQSLREYYDVRYQAKRRKKLERLSFFHLADNESLARRLKPHALDRNAIAFDIGAGAGQVCQYLELDRVIIIDISEVLLRSRLAREGTVGLCALAERLPLASKSVSLVIATQVLEHIPDYKEAISELGRVMKPGSILAIGVPSHYAYMMKMFHEISRNIDSSGHLRTFHPELLVEELSSQFRIVSTRQTGYIVFWMLMLLERSRFGNIPVRMLNSLLGRRASRLLSRLLDVENTLFRNFGGGMSYEVIAIRA